MVNVTCQTIFCCRRNVYRQASAWRNRLRVKVDGFDATDRQIDRLVYYLYRLTEEEIRMVEGDAK
jgi:hypothetical protein